MDLKRYGKPSIHVTGKYRCLDDDFNEPDDPYFTIEELLELRQHAGIVSCWSFQTALGDTIGEKFESLYLCLLRVTEAIIERTGPAYFWIAGHPVAIAFTEWSSTFHRNTRKYLPGFQYIGTLNQRWKVYDVQEFPNDSLLIGSGSRPLPPDYYARLTIYNP